MRGRTLLATVLAALVPAAPAAGAGDPVMPLSEVHPGLQCTGYTVFRGTAVEPFPVEVLDVVGQATSGETAARILVRASGPKVDATGVAAGFSGSPIYCPRPDGTMANAGAISETIGDFTGNVVFATPIEEILGTPVVAPRAPRGRALGTAAHRALLARARPLAAPLTVRGLGRAVFRDLARAASRRGVTVLQAPPAPLAAPAPQPLVPGSAVGVGMSSGDLALGGVGTVAYVDGKDVWAFGHEFDAAGARSLLLQDAYVSTIINNPVQTADGGGSYKLAGPVNDIGTITDDGFNAVVGRQGALPPLTIVRVHTRDADRGTNGTMRVKVADETDVGTPTGISNLGLVAPLAVGEAATEALGATPVRVAGRMCLQAVLRERKAPLSFCNRYVSDGTTTSLDGSVGNLVALAAGGDAAGALGLFDAYKGSRLHVRAVSARLTLTRGQHQAYLRAVRLPRRVRPGSRVRARLQVKVVRGRRLSIPFRWRVPRSLSGGRHRLTFEGADPDGSDDLFGDITVSFGDEEAQPDTEGPRSLRRLANAFRGFHRYDGITLKRGTHVYRDRTYRVGGRARATVVVRRSGGVSRGRARRAAARSAPRRGTPREGRTRRAG